MSALSYWKILTRKKALTFDGENEKLGRILGTYDLTALGVGATLGVGVYVLAGHVARDQAGPSVVLSFAIAAAASFLAGLCYAEFGARVPKSGSAYIYSYVCIGEFIAFIIGWNLMLEYIIGSASVSRGLSLYLDTLLNDTMKNAFHDVAPIHWDFMSNYFDFFAFTIAILLGIALAFGLKKSTIVNNFFTILNIGIVMFVIISGSFKADIANWQIDPANVTTPHNIGNGGFFPFGFEGTLKGAATCFFGFVGFDCIATTGEEVRNPRTAIPRAILFSLCIIFLAYFGVSTVLTLMWPYYLQDVNAPLPYVFDKIGWNFAKWVVAIGGIIGLIASLFGAMFPQPRIIYAMAQDGLIFRSLGEVSPKYKTPVFGTLCAAVLTGSMAGLFDLKALVNMLSIGTLMAYTVVAVSILILRHSENAPDSIPSTSSETIESTNLMHPGNRITASAFLLQIFNCGCGRLPTKISTTVIGVLVFCYSMVSLALGLTIMYANREIYDLEVWAISLSSSLLIVLLIIMLAMCVQPRETAISPFKVPLVPLLPCISIFVNIYLMLMLDIYTWIRFGIWMGLGIPMYVACVCFGDRGIKNAAFMVEQTKHETPYSGRYNHGFTNSEGDFTITSNNSIESNGITEKKLILLPMEQETQKIEATFQMRSVEIADATESEPTKSRTPSPKVSLDEIVLVSDFANQLTEKKEPNGKAYFIEDQNNNISDEKETSNAIAILDDMLDDEEKSIEHEKERLSPSESMNSPVFRAYSTIVDIHQEDKVTEEIQASNTEAKPEISEPETNDITNQVKPKKERVAFVFGQDDDLITESEDNEEYTKFGSRRQKRFMDHLSTLLVNTTPALPIKSEDDESSETEKSDSPTLQKSKSDPLFKIMLEELKSKDYESDTEDIFENPSTETNIPEPPKFDPVLFNTLGKSKDKNNPSRIKLDLTETSNVPPPPKFDPVLYNTIGGSKEKPLRPALIRKDSEEDDTILRKTNVDENNNTDVEPNSIEAFKNKLETILRRGPIEKVRPQTLPEREKSTTTHDRGVSQPETKQEKVTTNFKASTKPFDTVKKQRIIFDDVLKSINMDTKPSMIRNSLDNKTSLTEYKNGLNKTAPPKQFMPSV